MSCEHLVASAGNLQQRKKPFEMRWQFKESQGVTHRRSVENDFVVVRFQQVMDRKQGCDFSHARQSTIEEWL